MHLLDGAVRQNLGFNISRKISQSMRTGSRFPISPYLVAKLSPTLCNPMDCSMPGFSVIHYLLEFAKLMCTESVMSSNHLSFVAPSSPALSLSQNHGLFQ